MDMDEWEFKLQYGLGVQRFEMPEEELRAWIEKWRAGDRLAMEVVMLYLWQLYPVLRASLTSMKCVNGTQADIIFERGFGATLQELDMKLTGGAMYFVDVLDPKTGKVVRRGCTQGV